MTRTRIAAPVVAGVAATLTLLVPLLAEASIMMALGLPELVQKSEHIAVVEVGSVTAAWDARHERIYSTIELKIIERWKSPTATAAPAAAPERLTVVQPGGTVGDITMTVTGLGTFAEGERTLVFLRGPANHAQVVGMTQGKRPVRYEASTRRWLVAAPDLRDAKLIQPRTVPATTPTGLLPAAKTAPTTTPATSASRPAPPVLNLAPQAAPRDMALDEMRSEVQRLLGAGAK